MLFRLVELPIIRSGYCSHCALTDFLGFSVTVLGSGQLTEGNEDH